ncbi:MAG: hypothetical protein IKE11_11130 [Clostridia bacterium]|nr:hypothetical protein [Clostridia bacterium]
MKKVVALILTLSMLLCCFACGNSAEQEAFNADQEAIRIFRKSLLRPDTFILRSAYSFSGCPYNDDDYSYDELKQIKGNYIILTYTCENASGTVIECFGVFDKDNNTPHRNEDLTDYIEGKGNYKDPLTSVVYDFAGYLGLHKNYAKDRIEDVNRWITDGRLTKWDETKIDKINDSFQKKD